MVLRIADFYIDLANKGEVFKRLCKDYLCENPPYIDFTAEITEKDVAYEKALAGNSEIVGEGTYATNALYRKICAEILQRGGFLMHGVVIEYEGRGYLFTAKSGTGKTTHVLQWKKLFGDDKVTIVNGDKPIIRFIDGKVYAYGTPWNGKEHYGTNGRVELSAICFVERSEENSIERISDEKALPRLFSQIMIHDSSDLAKQLELVDKLLCKVPTYLLNCNISTDAAKVAYEGMCPSEDRK